MFTGIVKELGCVSDLFPTGEEFKIRVSLYNKKNLKGTFLSGMSLGDSVALDGICLTIEKFTKDGVLFHLGKETLRLTGWNEKDLMGKICNLEPPLSWGGRVGGHIVYGHVDGMAKLEHLSHHNKSVIWTVRMPKEYRVYVWKKAFIALNGVSLTVNEVKGACFHLCIVPHTLDHTNFSFQKKGSLLTFEVDSFVRAVVNAMKQFSFSRSR